MTGTAAWRKRVEAGRDHHGLGPSTYFPGNVQHLVNPVVGILRIMEQDGEIPDADDFAYLIDTLAFVLELAEEEDSKR